MGVRGGGWKGLAVRCGLWSAPFISVSVVDEDSVFDTRLASECVREFAVDTSCDCRLLEVLSAVAPVVVAGLASEFRRRNMPPTAYCTGKVKYEDARCGLGGGEDFCSFEGEDMARAMTM
jgi:hypothetical protein